MPSEKLESAVRRVLSNSVDARNDDRVLTLNVWWDISKTSFVQLGDQWYVSVEAIKKWLPQESSIKRIRAKIQNEYKELRPTDPAVELRRSAAKKDRPSFDKWKEKFID